MIFELDQKGLTGIWRGGLSIIAFWIIFMLGSFIVRWKLNKKRRPKVSDDALKEEDDQIAEIKTEGEEKREEEDEEGEETPAKEAEQPIDKG